MFRRTLGATSIALLALAPEALQPFFAPSMHAAGVPPDPAALEPLGDLGQVDTIDRQPLLIYDVSGSTLIGAVQSTVIVWSSGAVTHSRQDPFSDPVVGATKLAPAALEGLLAGLVEAGASGLRDQWFEVADVPLHTITVLGGTPDAAAHTFSYWIGTGQYAALDAVLARLMAEVQPVK